MGVPLICAPQAMTASLASLHLEQGATVTAREAQAPTRVRALLIPARGDTVNRGETVMAQHDDCTRAY
jgi:hypothetical protein